MTNLGVVDQSTTLGVVDGDLKGAVAATILNVVSGQGGTTTWLAVSVSQGFRKTIYGTYSDDHMS
jgi:hypothetical protein